MTPWPSAYAIQGGKTLKVLSARVDDGPAAGGPPGEIVAVGKDGIVVACGQGALRLLQVQPEGGKAMAAWAYAQGRRIAKGDRLSP